MVEGDCSIMQIIIKRKHSSLLKMFLSLFLALATWQCQNIHAQKQVVSVPVISSETYRRVLDIVFPRDADFSDDTKEFTLALRFISAYDEGATQINIVRHFDGRIAVTTYRLPEGSQGIGDQLNAILRQTGREDAEEMAKQIKVLKQVVSDTRSVRPLLTRFSALYLSPHLNTNPFILDPARFELWYKATSNEVYYSLAVPNLEQNHPSHPLAKWMTEVRRAVLGRNTQNRRARDTSLFKKR
jgi:hypothetical protein